MDRVLINDAIDYLIADAEAWEKGATGSPHEVYLMHSGKLRRELADRLRTMHAASPMGGPGIRISYSDALAMKQLLGEGKVDLVIGAIDDLIESRKAEVHADLAWNFDAWIKSYTEKMKPETMRFSVDEMRKAFEAGRDVFHPLPADVVRLVIAAREVAFGPWRPLTADADCMAAFDELDAASEAFASRVRWEDEPSDEEAAPEPTVHHGTINIDGQDHAIRLEIHQTEGGTFDADGHRCAGFAAAPEDDGFETILGDSLTPGMRSSRAIDLTGITMPRRTAVEIELARREASPSIPMVEISPAPVDLSQGVMVNGVLCAPLGRVLDIIGWERQSAVFDDNGPRGHVAWTAESRVAWEHGRDHMRDVAIRAMRAHFAFCAKCGGKPVITNLDGDDLCSPCATKWTLAEGAAERDAQDAAAEHGGEG